MRLLKIFRLLFSCAVAPVFAAEAPGESAVVTEGKINVRGKPGFIGEVITQLERGEKVTVIERIHLEKPKEGEPTNWARIKLPQNTPVWVFAPFVKDGKVAATRLNLRAGPGENHSVIGRLNRGDDVKAIRTVVEWMEVEAPEDAYAFIDLTLVKFDGTNAPPGIPTKVTPEAPTEPAAPNLAVNQPEPATNQPPTVVASTSAAPAPQENAPPGAVSNETVRSETAAVEPPAAPNPVNEPAVAPPAIQTSTPAPVATARREELPLLAPRKSAAEAKRIVRREGVVAATKSIQAPTWYQLVHPETGKVINYLYEERLGVKLKDYRGQKVMVSGEEAIDPRWPNTPIIDLETLDVLP